MGLIEIEGMEFYAYHGCFEEEQIIGNQFVVSLKMEYDVYEACKTDNLEKTIDYQSVYGIIKREMAIPSKLIEHVASRIIEAIHKEFTGIISSEIKVSKLNPPIGGKVKQVSVSLKKTSK